MSDLSGAARLASAVTATKFAVSSGLPAAGRAFRVKPPAPLPWQPAVAQASNIGWIVVPYVAALNGLGPGGGVTPPPSAAKLAAASLANLDSVASSGAFGGNVNGCPAAPPLTTAVRRLL